ncbi:MAG TPA: GNAT family N-acetyltransferase [Victivallales bacterium]|nr:GNAT family N-acetyltransferase [Victivallales bacterium]
MNYEKKILPAIENDYPYLLEVWENSVRATHHFLKEADIQSLKQFIPKYFKEVKLFVYKNDSEKIIGFLGIAKNKIEMLFIDSNVRGKGIGKKIANFAINNLNANKLDVNEQNPQAVGFYKINIWMVFI